MSPWRRASTVRLTVATLFVAVAVVLYRSARDPATALNGQAAPEPSRDVAQVTAAGGGSSGRRSISARPVESQPNQATTLIITVDELGTPVPDAELFVIRSGADIELIETQYLGQSDAKGERQVELLDRPPFVVVARATNHCIVEVVIEEQVPPRVELTLRRGLAIEGTVAFSDTNLPVGEGAAVLAWPTGLRLPPSDLAARALIGDPRCELVRTDRNGRFRFSALPPEGRFSLAAGLEGHAMMVPKGNVSPGGEPEETGLSRVSRPG